MRKFSATSPNNDTRSMFPVWSTNEQGTFLRKGKRYSISSDYVIYGLVTSATS